MALKPCPECGKEVSSEAKACPHCGVRLKTFSLPTWARIILVLAAPALLFMGYGLLRYGSATPCGMLKGVILERAQEEGDSPLGLALAGATLDGALAARSPLECVRGVWNDMTESKEEELDRKFDAYARSSLRRAMAAQRQYYVRNGRYTGTEAILDIGVTPGIDVSVSLDGSGYSATATSLASGSVFYVTDGRGRSGDGEIRQAIPVARGEGRRDRP